MAHRIPASPRRGSSGPGNPVTSDPKLIVMMENLDLVKTYDEFQNWKDDFLGIFESFLGDSGAQEAQQAYDDFRTNRMEKVVAKVSRVSTFHEKGDLTKDKVTVKARNSMNELSVNLIDTGKDVRELVPPTSAEEIRKGYTKYNLGAVLVRDGFQEYERMQMCKDILAKLRVDCLNDIGDEKVLLAIQSYDAEIIKFVSLMESLGLYKIMLKNREFDANLKDKPPPEAAPKMPAMPALDAPEPEPTPEPEPEPSKEEEKPAEEEPVSPTKKKKYHVGGSWGNLVDFDSPTGSKTSVKQDLADGSKHKKKNKAKTATDVFVTPARKAKGTVSKSMGALPDLALDDSSSPTSKKGAKPPIPSGKPRRPANPASGWASVTPKPKAVRRGSATGSTSKSSSKPPRPNAEPETPSPKKDSTEIEEQKDEFVNNVETQEGLNSAGATTDTSSHTEEHTTTTATTSEEPGVVHSVQNGSVTVNNNHTKEIIVEKVIEKHIHHHHHDNNQEHSGVRVANHKVTHVHNHDHHVVAGKEWIGTVPEVKPRAVIKQRVIKEGEIVRSASSIRLLTFCGIDDSVDPKMLAIICRCYPMVELAVLMRPDMAGDPRYASQEWLQKLAVVQIKAKGVLNLAAHLCGSFATEVLKGDDSIVKRLVDMQFKRIQINATAINGVSSKDLGKSVQPFLEIAEKYPDIEIAIQRNEETKALWEGVIEAGPVPENVAMLLDESKGMGVIPESWPRAPTKYNVGYAGGIGLGGRSMTKKVLKDILKVGNGQALWVSMESSLRCTKNGKDCFDVDKMYEIMDVATDLMIHLHPSFVA